MLRRPQKPASIRASMSRLSALARPFAARCLGLILGLATAATAPVLAWTPTSQILLGERAIRLAPSDFRNQLDKNEAKFREGLLDPFRTADATFHERNRDSGRLHEALAREVERTVAMIKEHQPFEQIAYQAGVVVHFVNDLNNPLACAQDDPSEPKYYADFLKYLQSTESRLRYLFYGLSPTLEGGSLEAFVEERLERCRKTYPLVGKEYRRIGKLPGTRYFDDRSTAFGISGVAHSRAISDAALVLRHIWLASGGKDWRQPPSETEGRYFEVETKSP